MNIFKIIRRFIPSYKKELVLNILFNLLSTVLSLFSFATIIPVLQILFGVTTTDVQFQPWSEVSGVMSFIDVLKNNIYFYISSYSADMAWRVLMVLSLFLIVMTALKCLCSWLAAFFLVPIRTGVLRDLRRQLYDKVLGLHLSFFSQEHKGDIISRMTNDVQEVENSIMASLDMLFKNPIIILIYLTTLFIISWQLTLFVLLILPLSGYIIGKIGRSLKRKSTKGQEQNAEILNQIEETLSALKVVKAFNAQNHLSERFLSLINETRLTFNRIHRRYALAHPMSEFLGTVLIAVLLFYGGTLILSDHSAINAPEFIYYLVIFYSIINPAKDLTKASYSIRKGTASLERIDKILNTPNIIPEPQTPIIPPAKIKSPYISYKNVSFHYGDDARTVLSGVSVDIEKGQTVAFVGESGTGKTTLLELLLRFYDVTGGQILLNGVDIRNISTTYLRSLVGYVNQDPLLFNDTFYNNIAFGCENATEEQIIEAAKVANAHQFIMQTAKQYQTTIGDMGSRLSGGQRQRLSIARAVLKNPPILILDEATSALDTENEKLVQQALDNLMRNRTTLVVAHRLSTIRNANLICVMQDGIIAEMGTHEQLLIHNGYYKHLLEMQS